jgi:hypothetical protein
VNPAVHPVQAENCHNSCSYLQKNKFVIVWCIKTNKQSGNYEHKNSRSRVEKSSHNYGENGQRDKINMKVWERVKKAGQKNHTYHKKNQKKEPSETIQDIAPVNVEEGKNYPQ